MHRVFTTILFCGLSERSRRLAPRLPEATPRGFGWLWRFSPSLVAFSGT